MEKTPIIPQAGEIQIVSCDSAIGFAKDVAERLDVGLTLAKNHDLSDGECLMKIDGSVLGKDVFLFQTFLGNKPINEDLMQLLFSIRTIKDAFAKRVTVVLPYLPYSRQDHPADPLEAFSSKTLALLLEAAGIDNLVSWDVHAQQVRGFYRARTVFLGQAGLAEEVFREFSGRSDVVAVAVDEGAGKKTEKLAQALGIDCVFSTKSRPKANEVKTLELPPLPGKDIAIAIDDIADTAGTLHRLAKVLHEKGIKETHYFISHPVLSGNAIGRLDEANKLFGLKGMVFTDSIPLKSQRSYMKTVSIVPMIADAILQIHSVP